MSQNDDKGKLPSKQGNPRNDKEEYEYPGGSNYMDVTIPICGVDLANIEKLFDKLGVTGIRENEESANHGQIYMESEEEFNEKRENIKNLSKKAHGSYKLLKDMCEKIYFAENLNLQNSIYETYDLLIKLTERVDSYLNDIHSLVWSYKNYSIMLEKLIYQAESKGT